MLIDFSKDYSGKPTERMIDFAKIMMYLATPAERKTFDPDTATFDQVKAFLNAHQEEHRRRMYWKRTVERWDGCPVLDQWMEDDW